MFQAMVVLWVATLAQASPQVSPKPTALPISVKVRELSAPLIESPEMMEECQQASALADSARKQAAEADAERKRIQEAYKPAAKPVSEMTEDELTAWKAGREKLKADLEAAGPRGGGVREQMGAEKICRDTALATLSKGTLLTVLSQQASMLNVRVETGRAVGKKRLDPSRGCRTHGIARRDDCWCVGDYRVGDHATGDAVAVE
jgi:hypothetical protein